MKKAKRFLSMLLMLCMILGLFPGTVFAAYDDNQPQPVEQWKYVPVAASDASVSTMSLAGESGSSGSSADIVDVHVTAIDSATGAEVSVENANVNLYVGTELKSTTQTDSEGHASVSLAGLSIEERVNATISANKVVSRGKAINGDARDDLFEHFPTDEDGEYYRYTMELHSETIDNNGNWIGAEIPTGYESNKVDIVFAIDATGSMSGEITNVKNNIASFSENLIASGLDIRFCIIEYRDITESENTIIHALSGSHWLNDIDSVVSELQSISATGGGDTPETVLDALGYVADNSLMSWRSDAYRFAFVLTDADYKVDNTYGYSSLSELTGQLSDMDVVTSVITSGSYQSDYTELYETTGGIYANINSSTFDEEMLALSNSIIESVTREMTLTLSEPRMLVNMSVCYFADDSTSQSESYREAVKNMLNEYSHRLAESTDGHVMIDKILLFSTSSLLNFYNTNNVASMADIRIETTEADSLTIHSNAGANGFYTDQTTTTDLKKYFPQFSSMPDSLSTRTSFRRIHMSGTEGAGWNNSMLDEAYEYSTTVMHETGHYLLGFFDEYMNDNAESWHDVGGRPYSAFGLMDNQHSDIEMSKDAIDYSYISKNNTPTYHWNVFKKSCESTLADLLMTGETSYDKSQNSFVKDGSNWTYSYYELPSGGVFDDTGDDAGYNQYAITYTKASGSDRTAPYSYAELGDSDFIPLPSATAGSDTSSWSLRASEDAAGLSLETAAAQNSVAEVSFTGSAETVTVSIAAEDGYTYSIGILKSGDEDFTPVEVTANTAELPIAKGELAEVRITASTGNTALYNTYYIDRSEDTSSGYIYTSADNAVMAYVTTDELSSYTLVADNTGYTNGDYMSINQATRITSDNGAGFDSGEIYSVASYIAEIDYTTLSWFKYDGSEWTALTTDYSEEENMNIGARADLDGEGLYVLMAKAVSTDTALPAEDLSYSQSADRDAVVTLTFNDPNTDSKYYNVYYSNAEFTDKNAEGVVVRSFNVDSTSLSFSLLERGRTVYAAVEIVLENGSRSELARIVLTAGEADSDSDGIPDWYCDKYLLWGKEGESKDIANSDDDGDGLTNLQEYQGDSDPTNPNDPIHTTNVPVESISVTYSEISLKIGETANVSVVVLPENATNKNVNWSSEDTSIATVETAGGVCTITAVADGEVNIYAVTADGGYSVTVKVTVFENDSRPDNPVIPDEPVTPNEPVTPDEPDSINPFSDVFETDYFYNAVLWAVENGITNGITPTIFSPELTCNRAQMVTFLWRAAGSPEPSATVCPFTDVDMSSYYGKAVLWAVEQGITNGTTATIFSPNADCTRAHMTAFMYRFADGRAVGTSNSFTDVDSDAYYAEAVQWAVENGITNGTSASTFSPDDPCTRAQIVTFLYRYFVK